MSFVVKDIPRMDYQIQNPVQPTANYQIPNVGNVLPGNVPHLPPVQGQDDPQRWTQYQHLWRQHVYNNMNGRIFVVNLKNG